MTELTDEEFLSEIELSLDSDNQAPWTSRAVRRLLAIAKLAKPVVTDEMIKLWSAKESSLHCNSKNQAAVQVLLMKGAKWMRYRLSNGRL